MYSHHTYPQNFQLIACTAAAALIYLTTTPQLHNSFDVFLHLGLSVLCVSSVIIASVLCDQSNYHWHYFFIVGITTGKGNLGRIHCTVEPVHVVVHFSHIICVLIEPCKAAMQPVYCVLQSP